MRRQAVFRATPLFEQECSNRATRKSGTTLTSYLLPLTSALPSIHLVVTSVLRIPVSLKELVSHNAAKPVVNNSHVVPNTSKMIVDRFSPYDNTARDGLVGSYRTSTVLAAASLSAIS